jgi:NAD(P)-dependent dehydrogenase (short-subunit alcohol dehydrogenase family)
MAQAGAKLAIAALPKSIALDMQKHNVRSSCIAPLAVALASDAARDVPRVRQTIAGVPVGCVQ